jgi:hypothetical protein
MSIHSGLRAIARLVKVDTNSSRDEDVAEYGGTGEASGGSTPTGQALGSNQVALRYRGDAPMAADVVEVTVDGGTTWQRALGKSPGSSRFALEWVAGQRGKPGVNGDIQNIAEATRMVADADFEVLGTNASSGDVTFYAEGGIKLETDGADGDEIILLPHLDANQSAWAQVTWGTDKAVAWECVIKTGSAIDNCIIWAGLKLTNTEVTATDDDQAFFRYEDAVNDGEFQCVSSVGGTDDAHDSGLVVAVDTVYHLQIVITAARTAEFWVNGVLYETSAALTDTTDLIPYIGVASDGAAEAKHIYVFSQNISRTVG